MLLASGALAKALLKTVMTNQCELVGKCVASSMRCSNPNNLGVTHMEMRRPKGVEDPLAINTVTAPFLRIFLRD